MKTLVIVGSCILGLSIASAVAQTASPEHAIITPADKISWADAPQFGPGAKSAVLAGDPTKSGPYVMRLMLPANASVPAHTHPDAENVTVISGTVNLGFGETADKSKAQQLGSGSFFLIPANTPHFATVSEATVLQVHGMGPSAIKILEPAVGSTNK